MEYFLTLCISKRGFKWRLLAALGSSLCGLLPATESIAAGSRTENIHIEYVQPKNPDYANLANSLKKARVLEYVRDVLGAIRLPRILTVKLADCGGVSNAWYANDELRVCYEYASAIYKDAAEHELPIGISRDDTIIGPLLDAFLHESGHAIFDYLDVPIFGREEDAADQFSTFIMLRYDKERARRLILGSAYQYRLAVKEPQLAINVTKFADEHGLPAQRFFNVLCTAYGADPGLFADVVRMGFLPPIRAAGCEDEYKQTEKAFRKLIMPYVNRATAKKAFKRRQ